MRLEIRWNRDVLERPARRVTTSRSLTTNDVAGADGWLLAVPHTRQHAMLAPHAERRCLAWVRHPRAGTRYFECAVRDKLCDWASPAPTEDAWPGLDEAPPMRLVKEFLEAPYALDQCADASALIEPYRVPAKTINSDAAWCFDVVAATDSIPTACFAAVLRPLQPGHGVCPARAADR